MSSLLEFLSLAAFVLSYWWKGIYVATGTLMVTTVLAVGASWLLTRKVKPLLLILMVLSLVFGSLTLFLRDPRFLQWKFSLVEWLMGLILLGSQVLGKRPFMRLALEEALKLPEPVWTRLNLMWAGFFLFLGTLNVYVIYNFSLDAWVRFKLFGSLGLTLAFTVVQAIYIARHLPAEDKT